MSHTVTELQPLQSGTAKLMWYILYIATPPTGKAKITVNNRKQEKGGEFHPSTSKDKTATRKMCSNKCPEIKGKHSERQL